MIFRIVLQSSWLCSANETGLFISQAFCLSESFTQIYKPGTRVGGKFWHLSTTSSPPTSSVEFVNIFLYQCTVYTFWHILSSSYFRVRASESSWDGCVKCVCAKDHALCVSEIRATQQSSHLSSLKWSVCYVMFVTRYTVRETK